VFIFTPAFLIYCKEIQYNQEPQYTSIKSGKAGFAVEGMRNKMIDSIRKEKIAIGVRQSIKAVLADEVQYLFIAEDTEPGVLDNILEESKKRNIEVRAVESMAILGKNVGIDVGSSVVAVLKNV